MIRLSPRGKIQYQFLSLIVILLILYCIGFLLEALFELPRNPLAQYLDKLAVNRFASRCLALLILTGLVAAGTTMASESLSERMLYRFQLAWSALMFVTLIASPFAQASFLDALTAIGLLALLALTLSGKGDSAFLRVWQLGMLLVCLSLIAKLFANSPWDKVLDLFRLHVAYGMSALSVAFWLMTRFSTVELEWANDGVKIVAGLLVLSGSLLSLAPLGLPALVSISATPLIVLCYTILAGHAYRAISMRNHEMSLAPHWIAVATLFWLVAGGFLGAISLHAGVNSAMQGTAVSDAQGWITSWVVLTIICAYLNSAACELRGGNRRVTGYVPLWLVAFGVGLSSILAAIRGVVEIYLRDGFGLERVAVIEMTQPLTLIWIICLLAVAVGVITFSLGFWARRPKIHVESR